MDKNFAQSVEDQCDKELVALGLKRPRKGTRYLEITDNFLGWVGLNRGSFEGHLRINPFIGIHCIPIMKLREELQGNRYKKGQYATFAIHLGEICPDIKQFIFEDDGNMCAEAKRLSSTIREYGFPWMNEHANYERLLPLIESRTATLGGYPQSVALGYFLMGRNEKAHEFVTLNSEIFYKDENDPKSIYNRFTEPFLKFLNDKSSQLKSLRDL